MGRLTLMLRNGRETSGAPLRREPRIDLWRVWRVKKCMNNWTPDYVFSCLCLKGPFPLRLLLVECFGNVIVRSWMLNGCNEQYLLLDQVFQREKCFFSKRSRKKYKSILSWLALKLECRAPKTHLKETREPQQRGYTRKWHIPHIFGKKRGTKV